MSRTALRTATLVIASLTIAVALSACSGKTDAGSKANAKASPTMYTEPPASCQLPKSHADITDANLGFAFRTFSSIDAPQRVSATNTTYSPYSLSTALQMLLNGADHRASNANPLTQQQLLASLCFDNTTVTSVNTQARTLLTNLTKQDPGATLSIANSIWTAPGRTPAPNVAAAIRRDFNGDLKPFSYGKPEPVNAWIADHTKNRVPKILTAEDLNEDLVMLLINALAFDGTWTSRFSPASTSKFNVTPKRAVDVKMMTDDRTAPLYSSSSPYGTGGARGGQTSSSSGKKYRPSAEFDAVRLTYGTSKRFAMVVVVPRDVDGLNRVIKRLDAAQWRKVTAGFENQEVMIGLPKIKLNELRDITKPVLASGVPRESYNSLIVEREGTMYIDFIKQGTALEIDEHGTKAAAATVIGVSAMAGGPSGYPVYADHPYLVVIEDTKTHTILMMSAVRNPVAD